MAMIGKARRQLIPIAIMDDDLDTSISRRHIRRKKATPGTRCHDLHLPGGGVKCITAAAEWINTTSIESVERRTIAYDTQYIM